MNSLLTRLSDWWRCRHLSKEQREWLAWFEGQQAALAAGEEIEPPWRAFPDAEALELGPLWSGWRQGKGEPWMKGIWNPYWRSLSEADRQAYLDRWEAPEYWREYLAPDPRMRQLAEKERGTVAGHALNLSLIPRHGDGEET